MKRLQVIQIMHVQENVTAFAEIFFFPAGRDCISYRNCVASISFIFNCINPVNVISHFKRRP